MSETPPNNFSEEIKAHHFTVLRERLADMTPDEIADTLRNLEDDDDIAVLFRLLPRDQESKVFEYLDRPTQEALIHALGHEHVAMVLNEMAPDDRTTLLEELPSNVSRELINLLSPAERTVATELLGYPPNSIGRRMTPDYIAVRSHWTVQQVFDYIRQNGKDSESLLVVYVTNEQGKLLDDVRIRRFLLAPLDTRVFELQDHHFLALHAQDDQETAVDAFKRYDREALPVIDGEGILVGILTVDDVLDVAEEETTEDIQKMGGSEAFDEPYMTIPFWRMVKKRAGWLVILFLGEMLTATAMSYFEMQIQKAVVLALFIPLVISSGGNSGSQASTLVIRAMAIGEVRLRDWWHIMKRELASGAALGTILGFIGFLRITTWSMFSTVYGPHWFLVAITIFFALIGIVLWGTLSGSMLPMLLRKVGFDPAASSAPFVATLVDVTGLVIYFTVATIILKGTLLASAPERPAVHQVTQTTMAIAADSTSPYRFTVTSGTGAKLGNLQSPVWVTLTPVSLADSVTFEEDSVTAIHGDTITVSKRIGPNVGKAWPVGTRVSVRNALTKVG
jgi:magnesium transporter